MELSETSGSLCGQRLIQYSMADRCDTAYQKYRCALPGEPFQKPFHKRFLPGGIFQNCPNAGLSRRWDRLQSRVTYVILSDMCDRIGADADINLIAHVIARISPENDMVRIALAYVPIRNAILGLQPVTIYIRPLYLLE